MPKSSSPSLPALPAAALVGALGFGVPSLVVFATVAYGERWMYETLGLWGAYGVWTLLFILPSGLALRSLVVEPGRRRRFPGSFAGAFFLYAIGWMAAYFLLRNSYGELPAEVLASVVASALLALSLALVLGSLGRGGVLFGVLLAANTVGYFSGGALYAALGRPLGMLLWGATYGVLLGTGIGVAIHLAQKPPASA